MEDEAEGKRDPFRGSRAQGDERSDSPGEAPPGPPGGHGLPKEV